MNAKKPQLVDNAVAPEMFATHAVDFSLAAGDIVSITLASQRSVDGDFVDVVVGRLVMPLVGYQEMVREVSVFLANFPRGTNAKHD